MSAKSVLTVGSLRGTPQLGGVARPRARAPMASTAHRSLAPGTVAPRSLAVVQSGTELPPSRRGQRCCRTGCAGCPVGEAIRRARAQSPGA